MANDTSTINARWQWSWENLCGEEVFQIWSIQRHDFNLCFEQLCLDIPVLFLLAVFSAYYCGRQEGFVTRGKIQALAINLRCVVVLILTSLPIIHLYIGLYKTNKPITDISYLLSAVQGISWFTHFIYNVGLRKRLGLSPRGPIGICITWSLIFALNVISTRSHYLLYKYSFTFNYSIYINYVFSICYLVVHIVYAITLIPSEGSTTYLNFSTRYTELAENQPLLHNAYVRFVEEGDPAYLGVAMENTHWISKLLFSWVSPLMDKGYRGQVKTIEDLYDLPPSLTSGYISAKLNKHFVCSTTGISRKMLIT